MPTNSTTKTSAAGCDWVGTIACTTCRARRTSDNVMGSDERYSWAFPQLNLTCLSCAAASPRAGMQWRKGSSALARPPQVHSLPVLRQCRSSHPSVRRSSCIVPDARERHSCGMWPCLANQSAAVVLMSASVHIAACLWFTYSGIGVGTQQKQATPEAPKREKEGHKKRRAGSGQEVDVQQVHRRP